MASKDQERAERAGVNTDVTVSPEPAHSTLPKQAEEDLKAEPVDTLDPDVAEAQGRKAD